LSDLNTKNYLIIGGSGFIGQNLIQAIDKKNNKITLIGRETTDFSFLDKYEGIKTIKGDFSKIDTFIDAARGQHCIINLLGSTLPATSLANPKKDIDFNIIPALYMLEAAVLNGVKKIIFASSGGAVYGDSKILPISEDHMTNPQNMYGISKLMIEKMLLAWNKIHNMDNIILRIGNVYGIGQKIDKNFGAVSVFLEKINNSKKIEIWGNGDIVRDYIYIDDVVNAFILALNTNIEKNSPKIFNIGTGIGTSINELIETIEKITKKKSIIYYDQERTIDVKNNVLKIDNAKTYLQFSPKFSLKQGIKKCYDNIQ
jgi:UDP-glucose 4-epimerase